MKSMTFAKRAVSAAVVAFASLGANAGDMTFGVGTVVPGNSFSQVIQKSIGNFSDTWNFTIGVPLYSAGSVSNLAISVPGLNLFNITGLSAQLYEGGGNFVQNLDLNPGSTADLKVGSGLFAPGDYYFKVSGNASGNFGGQYVFAVTTLPVPEPESYAMFLAGLGIMGAIAARRNKAKKQS